MGAKESKLQYFPFEEACKRMKDTEMKRSKDAFKRVATLGGQMSDIVFCREVLGDGVPAGIANLLYRGFGGTSKGLSLKDLLCGLVILTKGSQEEKIKLLFGMYADDSYSYVQKEEMDRLVLESEGQISVALSDLFQENDQVSFDYFRLWVKKHPDATEMTKWLLMEHMTVSLSDDTDTPTFYQTLAGVTHLEETDISELEKRYWTLKSQSKSGKFDLDTFKAMVCPPVPEAICDSLFHAFDENRDNHIDFKEMACGISACCRGPGTERQKFCFKVFDVNHDGKLCERELVQMVQALLRIRQENHPSDSMECDPFYKMEPETVAREILASHDSDKDGCISQAEYLVWTVNNALADNFLDLLSQICHLVMGLKPQTKEEEGEIIKQWLQRESKKAFEVGQVWYLISMGWWNSWIEYVTPQIQLVNGRLDNGEGDRMNGTETLHKITKGKQASKALPWDDDSVIIVNMITKGKNSEYNTQLNGSLKSSTIPQRSQSACNSPIKTCLSASDSNGFTSVSPGPSPKLRKKGLQQTSALPVKPGPIDNSNLITSNNSKVVSLTAEGGRLRRDTMLVRGKDFELVPEVIWRALSTWYGGNIALPRTVISSKNNNGNPELELYPITVKLLRHQIVAQRPTPTSFTGVMSGIGGMALSMTNYVSSAPPIPRRYVAFTATFSKQHTIQQIYEFLCTKVRFIREDIRLWKIGNKDDIMTLLEDESMTVEDCGIEENQSILIEVRNKDLTWPEEISQLAKNKTCRKEQVPTQKGATGLNNLGNTCFMNAAVQCVSNTWPLTQYFIGGLHLFELNRSNPLGMKGHIAQRYGELVKDLWSGTSKTIAPLKLRWTIGKYAPRFNGFQQHDSQELLSFLLDGLHEDLNRVHVKPYVELKDSDGREDEVVAEEAWENHLRRNQSIIVDLFHGQLKSQVRCKECGHLSVRFDPFNYLSLPLPMDSCIHLEVIVTRLDGSVPIKYGIRLNMDEKYKALKKELSRLTSIPPDQILFVEIMGPIVKALPKDNQMVKTLVGGVLYAYELPPHEEIKPMTIEEEKGTVLKNSVGLNDIQRGLATKKIQQKLENGPSSVSNALTVEDSSANNTPTHSRHPSDVPTMGSLQPTPENPAPKASSELFSGFVIGVHRKMNLMDVYFLSSQKARPGLFGTPIILPCVEDTTNQDLYQFVWTQVSRLVSPLPPSESKSANHAQDCDDSLGYEYPFTLKVVKKDGFSCAWCPWYRFCRGCKVECNADDFNFGGSFLAIDWEPTALHLRYQTALERLYEDHDSVEDSRRKQTEPINLDTCLQAFTTEEELGEDELYYCSKCKKHCLASKKLDIWRLPPILIVNLKRFQFLNGRWVKSHKIVNFPEEDFDPSNYLAPRVSSSDDDKQSVTCVCQSESSAVVENVPNGDIPNHKEDQIHGDMTYSPDSLNSPCMKCQLTRNIPTEEGPIKYNLSSMSCHTGILGGGHYVCYAKNPNQKWYCYNDSSCKECSVEQMDCNSAYILFYERQNIDFSHFMPDVEGKEPDLQEIDDEFESDLKKACVLQ